MKFLQRILCIILCIIFSKIAFGSSVVLYNDSSFVLTATIRSARGAILGSVTVKPNDSTIWQETSSGAPAFSETPYTVNWTCEHGSPFAVSVNVPSGGTATPLNASGAHYCQPPEKKDQETTPPNGRIPQEIPVPYTPSPSNGMPSTTLPPNGNSPNEPPANRQIPQKTPSPSNGMSPSKKSDLPPDTPDDYMP